MPRSAKGPPPANIAIFSLLPPCVASTEAQHTHGKGTENHQTSRAQPCHGASSEWAASCRLCFRFCNVKKLKEGWRSSVHLSMHIICRIRNRKFVRKRTGIANEGC